VTGKWRKNITYDKAPWFDFAVSDIQSVDYIEIQYRKDANHDPHRCGKDCRHGTGRLPLPAPPARASLRLFKIAPGDFVEPLDFVARLAALVTKPRVNLTRFHGVFAPNSKHRALVTSAKWGKGNKAKVSDEPQTPAERRASGIVRLRAKTQRFDSRGFAAQRGRDSSCACARLRG
jgi:hypothetical protein